MSILFGKCPYTSYMQDTLNSYSCVHVVIPQNMLDINDMMCEDLNREGLLCAGNKEGYGPAILSKDSF